MSRAGREKVPRDVGLKVEGAPELLTCCQKYHVQKRRWEGKGERGKSCRQGKGRKRRVAGRILPRKKAEGGARRDRQRWRGTGGAWESWLAAGRAYSEDSSSRSSAKNGCFAATAPAPLPRPPLAATPGPPRVCERRPALTRQKRLEWQSSRLAPFGTKQELILTATTHTPLSHSLRQERKRQTERGRERETDTERERGRGHSAHAQIIIQLNKGFTDRHSRTRNSGRINNPGGEWYRRAGGVEIDF